MATNNSFNFSGDVVVSIRCTAYNHEPYIRQCLEGFVMQQTNFKFEAIVHDDASTDGTADIIREYAEKYPDIIIPIFETENQYSKHDGSLTRIMNAHMRGKYIALCEGDDYWTDSLKLQKQVDFLESHPDFSLCCHRIKFYFEDTECFQDKSIRNESANDEPIIFTNYENLQNWYTETASLMYRNGLLDSVDINKYKFYRDTHQNYHLLNKGKGAYLPFCGSVYRKHSAGIYSSLSWIDAKCIGYQIYSEIRFNNSEDPIICNHFNGYREIIVHEVRYMLSQGICDDGVRKIIGIIIKENARNFGIMESFKYCIKFIKTYMKGKCHLIL